MKESTTLLLHKKGNEADLQNYRPIALANTMNKLWTGTVSESLRRFAEENNILSSSQKGHNFDHFSAQKLVDNIPAGRNPAVGPISPDQDICIAVDGMVHCHSK